jgi:uncharacterized protein YdeI (YjbR/CyaY-like superfamily)
VPPSGRLGTGKLELVAAELPELIIADRAAWRAWLAGHHQDPLGVWLVLAKKGTTAPTSLSHDDALEEAIAHGWIDGQVSRRGETTFAQRFTPRRRRSAWSRRNVGIAVALLGEGRMHPAGLAEVERAQADGRWEAAYAGPASIELPEELRAALAANPLAASNFELLTSQNRYALLYRIATAKRPATRLKRIDAFVAMLGRGETFYPQKRALGR